MIYDDIQKICKGYLLSIVSTPHSADYSPQFTSHAGGRTMKRNILLTLALVGVLGAAGLAISVAARPAAPAKNAFTPDDIPYGPAPAFVAPGAQLAVLEGNPGATSGDYTVRLKMPDGYRIAPHW